MAVFTVLQLSVVLSETILLKYNANISLSSRCNGTNQFLFIFFHEKLKCMIL